MLQVVLLDLDHFRDGREGPPRIVDAGVLQLRLYASSRVVVGEIKTSFHGGPACITGRMDSTKREGSIDKFSREGGHVASLLTKAVFFFVDELRIGLG